jgi:hypothetical protein
MFVKCHFQVVKKIIYSKDLGLMVALTTDALLLFDLKVGTEGVRHKQLLHFQ